MSILKLKDRIETYQNISDYKLLGRVPVIISVNGRSFDKTTSLIDKPFCQKFSDIMANITLKLCSEIEGTIFSYQFNDEIVLITRNDQNVDTLPWYDNRIQKICSVASSVATFHFNSLADNLDLIGEGMFTTQVFVVPNLAEAINTIIYKQQQNFHLSVQMACFYELIKKYNKNSIKEMISGLSMDEKIDLLGQECGVDFNTYPIGFRRGLAAYKIPKVVGEIMKNKWFINDELPIFTKDPSFLSNIMKNGGIDIFRRENL